MDLIRRIADRRREAARLRAENEQLRSMLADERRALAVARHAAYRDPLTGLPNCRHLYQRAGALLATTRPVVALMLDLDAFKPVNDEIGHAAGDAVLAAVARRFAAVLGNRWLVARLGGDEFAGVRPGATAEPVLVAEAAAVAAAIAQPIRVGRYELAVGCSIGLVVANGPIGLPELLARADAALARSKNQGSRPVVWHPCRDDGADRCTEAQPAVLTRDLVRSPANGSLALVDRRDEGHGTRPVTASAPRAVDPGRQP